MKITKYSKFGAFKVEPEDNYEFISLENNWKKCKTQSGYWIPYTQRGIEFLKEHFNLEEKIILKEPFGHPVENIPEFLFDFQKEDVEKAVKYLRRNFGLINASVVGSGKTFFAYSVARCLGAKKVLIVCPNSLKEDTWFKVSQKFNVEAKIEKNADYVIVNYEKLLSKKFNWIFQESWDLVIADEAHKLKNPRAKRSKSFLKLNTKNVILLTGTPCWNKPENFFNLLRICAPLRFSDFKKDYVEKYFSFKYLNIKNRKILKIIDIVRKDEFLYDIKDLYIRREREEISNQLPKVIKELRKVELSNKEKSIYNKVAEEIVEEIENEGNKKTHLVLLKMLRLRQVAISPELLFENWNKPSTKIEELIEFIEDTSEQIVVFTTFKKAAEITDKYLKQAGIQSEFITGDFDIKERNKRIQLFKEGRYQVLVATPYISGEGLNLQNASVVVFLDRDYVPDLNKQAEGRVVRIGQQKTTTVVNIVAKNTIDETILENIEFKRLLQEKTVLSSKEIESIIKGKKYLK